ncbi:hypothetical protein [Vibrio parahaemolyticus]|uniref:hypothetical protein n=1 Tax=Vibrio parahaemolyticus TaxID=670 RepID=UPI00084B312B|nr:hypothetical protein [Vibrio parahaemolyticus]ODW25959.1 hypothetical protein BBM88_14775 [Vibrio parahaemolyticus]ODY75253.1 hypothetical protein BBM27_02565 [Vibrio parahaemolyticus]ODY75259.1 hypothetical protein BBM28_05125 [Vibrio parahaemolyticus]
MNEIVKNVLSTIIGAAIVGVFGYVLVVKENQLKIDTLQKTIEEQSARLTGFADRQDVAINSIRLFVVSNHPDKDHSTLLSRASFKKLQNLSPQEYPILVKGLNSIVEPTEKPLSSVTSANFEALLLKHNLEQVDLNTYVAELRLQEP